ncbi:MAG: hypothetical protein HWE07_06145 [Cytophagia bacterium]|nr:hypothetical protein [Cytophagia bacterium]
MTKKVFLFLFILLGSFSCSQSDIDILEVEATVQDVQQVAGLESCEWLLFFNGKQYKPSYLPLDYREDGLQVRMKIELLPEKASCNSSIDQIRIEQISLAN